MSKKSNLASAAVCFVFGALALAFGQGHFPNGLVLLIGIILWIRFFRVADPKFAVPMVTIANVLVWEWAYAGMVPLPTAARIGMFTGISLVFGLLFLADRWANLRLNSLLATTNQVFVGMGLVNQVKSNLVRLENGEEMTASKIVATFCTIVEFCNTTHLVSHVTNRTC